MGFILMVVGDNGKKILGSDRYVVQRWFKFPVKTEKSRALCRES